MKDVWLETYTGKRFYPLDPRPEDVDIRDIAHGLSLICRFNGQCQYFFSVAQHSLNCAEFIRRQGAWATKYVERWQLLCLLHDAAEAYISDLPGPLKAYIPKYKEIEQGIMQAIYEGLGIKPPSIPDGITIKYVDKMMLATEAAALVPSAGVCWECWPPGIKVDDKTIITELPAGIVEDLFLNAYFKLIEGGAEPYASYR